MLKIRELRSERNLTQEQLAKEIGVKNYTVANWEQGRTSPSIEDLCALSDFFECSIDYLLGRSDEMGNIIISKNLSDDEIKILILYKNLSTKRKEVATCILSDMQISQQIEER